MADWKPDLYLRFEKERTQPSVDLANRIELKSPKKIIDIGCGPGNSAKVLKDRWPGADVLGIDLSEAMVTKARASFPGMRFLRMDAGGDLSALGRFDIVFSNAAIQWIPDNKALIARLHRMLEGGGALAIQVPCTRGMPIQQAVRELSADARWAGRFGSVRAHSMHGAEYYYDAVSAVAGEYALWRTDYVHVMRSHAAMVEWYSATALKPYLECLEAAELPGFLCEFERRLIELYPARPDGNILFPFTRLFMLAYG
jgi:trans-aconitate 2-methyltransferase